MTARTTSTFRTEIEFCLPKGYLDDAGVLHRQGVMRLATAADEILPLRDPRVQQNAAYLAIIVLSRVIVKLGALANIDVKVIESLYASDFDYLQRLYESTNGSDEVDQPAKPALNGRLAERGGFGVMGEA